MAKIYISNVTSRIEGLLAPQLLTELTTECSYAIMGAEFSSLYQDGHWDGTKKLFNSRQQSFPTGLLARVRKVLEKNGVAYELCDIRRVPFVSKLSFYPPGPLRDYQEHCISTGIGCTRGVIKAATGAGKSVIIGGLIANTNVNTLVVVHTTSLFAQTIKGLEKMLRIPIGRIGAGERKLEKITVALMQSLVCPKTTDNKKDYVAALKVEKKKKKKAPLVVREDLIPYINSIECLIVDECHHISCESVQAVSNIAENAYFRLGMSASPWRDDELDILIEAVTGRQLTDIKASDLINRGYLTQPEINLVYFKHSRQPKSIKYAELYSQEIVNNPNRNELICNIVKNQTRQNNSILVAVQRINHGDILKELLLPELKDKVRFVNGEHDPEQLLQTLVDLHEKKILCAIATSVYKEGVDIPGLNALIIANATDSTVTAFQLVGRVLRTAPGKKKVFVYDIADEGCRWFGDHVQSRLDIYRTEPMYELRAISGDEFWSC